MSAASYRVESAHPIISPLWLGLGSARFHLVFDRALAIVLAAKGRTSPTGHEIRVVHVPTGQVVFRKTATSPIPFGDGF
ncbi:MAG: hypothetical protein ACOYNZ_01415 [Rhodoferax sp.]